MELKERRTEAASLLRSVRRAAEEGEPLPERHLAADGYAFLVAEVGLGISILGGPISPLETSMAELRGKLQALAGPPPYRTEASSEAFTFPMLVCGPEGPVSEVYAYAGDDGCLLGGNEAERPDWPEVVAAFEAALAKVRPVDFEDRVYDPDSEAWIYYGVRRGEPFEEMSEGEDPPDWVE